MNKVIYKNLFFASLLAFCLPKVAICMEATVIDVALKDLCTGKSIYGILDHQVPMLSIEGGSFGSIKTINQEAINNAYTKINQQINIKPHCPQLFALSEADIKTGLAHTAREENILLREWAGFYELYPNPNGIIKISNIGISKDKNYAVFSLIIQCGPLCGSASIIQYKYRDGKWIRDKDLLLARS